MHTTRQNHRGESGFTLIELLVVILIIGILAAIAIPAYLGQRLKAQDSDAKSNARNMVSQIEACYRNTDGYLGCTAELTVAATGLPIGGGAGQVSITDEQPNSYVITATSQARTGVSQHVFVISHTAGGTFVRTCAPAGAGGCRSDNTW